MASEILPEIRTPTLLIVGGTDRSVLNLNREAYVQLTCENELHVVPGADHLFEGEGELEEVAAKAADWFVQHLH